MERYCRKDADLNLETLTVLTGGKKYFVADGDFQKALLFSLCVMSNF